MRIRRHALRSDNMLTHDPAKGRLLMIVVALAFLVTATLVVDWWMRQ
jgi:hypothetical protein